MLRVSLLASRAATSGSFAARAGRQWHVAQVGGAASAGRRYFAEKPSIADSKPAVLPGSASDATSEPLPPGAVAETPSSSIATSTTPVTPASSTIPAANVPLTPPPPPTSTASSLSPSPPPKKRRFFRRFFSTVIILSALGFGGGVYLSRTNDNFHDFFTEFVPFGEEAVLYFEERDFKKRFPSISSRTTQSRDTGNRVTIPSQSGVSWRVSEEDKKQTTSKLGQAVQTPTEAKASEKAKAVEQVKKDSPSPVKAASPSPPSKASEPARQATLTSGSARKNPEVNEPSRFPDEVTRIDPINIEHATEPLVQDLVHIINDIITVVNADNANNRFSATIDKAKTELSKVGAKIQDMKAFATKDADEKVKTSHADFDRAAKELVRRLEAEMQDQEARWKEEYEQERQKIQQNYEQKLKSEVERQKELNEHRLQNELLQQAYELKRQFTGEVKDHVEREREARLGKLSDLTNTVGELEKLTTDWNSVVDANLKTQHLHVAVEAVRANLDKAQMPKPFVRELAALKEIASDDPVVDAAIGSINPSAYQRGIPTSGQLIDRFRRVAGEVRKASLLPEEAGVASHASSYVLSKLLFKKKGLATGDDVESILTRTETYLEEGDLDGAAREMNGLNGWAKTLSRDWLSEVRKVLEVQQALDVIATEARLQSLRVE